MTPVSLPAEQILVEPPPTVFQKTLTLRQKQRLQKVLGNIYSVTKNEKPGMPMQVALDVLVEPLPEVALKIKMIPVPTLKITPLSFFAPIYETLASHLKRLKVSSHSLNFWLIGSAAAYIFKPAVQGDERTTLRKKYRDVDFLFEVDLKMDIDQGEEAIAKIVTDTLRYFRSLVKWRLSVAYLEQSPDTSEAYRLNMGDLYFRKHKKAQDNEHCFSVLCIGKKGPDAEMCLEPKMAINLTLTRNGEVVEVRRGTLHPCRFDNDAARIPLNNITQLVKQGIVNSDITAISTTRPMDEVLNYIKTDHLTTETPHGSKFIRFLESITFGSSYTEKLAKELFIAFLDWKKGQDFDSIFLSYFGSHLEKDRIAVLCVLLNFCALSEEASVQQLATPLLPKILPRCEGMHLPLCLQWLRIAFALKGSSPYHIYPLSEPFSLFTTFLRNWRLEKAAPSLLELQRIAPSVRLGGMEEGKILQNIIHSMQSYLEKNAPADLTEFQHFILFCFPEIEQPSPSLFDCSRVVWRSPITGNALAIASLAEPWSKCPFPEESLDLGVVDLRERPIENILAAFAAIHKCQDPFFDAIALKLGKILHKLVAEQIRQSDPSQFANMLPLFEKVLNIDVCKQDIFLELSQYIAQQELPPETAMQLMPIFKKYGYRPTLVPFFDLALSRLLLKVLPSLNPPTEDNLRCSYQLLIDYFDWIPGEEKKIALFHHYVGLLTKAGSPRLIELLDKTHPILPDAEMHFFYSALIISLLEPYRMHLNHEVNDLKFFKSAKEKLLWIAKHIGLNVDPCLEENRLSLLHLIIVWSQHLAKKEHSLETAQEMGYLLLAATEGWSAEFSNRDIELAFEGYLIACIDSESQGLIACAEQTMKARAGVLNLTECFAALIKYYASKDVQQAAALLTEMIQKKILHNETNRTVWADCYVKTMVGLQKKGHKSQARELLSGIIDKEVIRNKIIHPDNAKSIEIFQDVLQVLKTQVTTLNTAHCHFILEMLGLLYESHARNELKGPTSQLYDLTTCLERMPIDSLEALPLAQTLSILRGAVDLELEEESCQLFVNTLPPLVKAIKNLFDRPLATCKKEPELLCSMLHQLIGKIKSHKQIYTSLLIIYPKMYQEHIELLLKASTVAPDHLNSIFPLLDEIRQLPLTRDLIAGLLFDNVSRILQTLDSVYIQIPEEIDCFSQYLDYIHNTFTTPRLEDQEATKNLFRTFMLLALLAAKQQSLYSHKEYKQEHFTKFIELLERANELVTIDKKDVTNPCRAFYATLLPALAGYPAFRTFCIMLLARAKKDEILVKPRDDFLIEKISASMKEAMAPKELRPHQKYQKEQLTMVRTFGECMLSSIYPIEMAHTSETSLRKAVTHFWGGACSFLCIIPTIFPDRAEKAATLFKQIGELSEINQAIAEKKMDSALGNEKIHLTINRFLEEIIGMFSPSLRLKKIDTLTNIEKTIVYAIGAEAAMNNWLRSQGYTEQLRIAHAER